MSEAPNRSGKHLILEDVLSAEYEALRPGGSYAGATDKASLFAKAHEESTPFSALCISGGGIRSATFALGALQGLAKHGILDKFDYLSTVSGGGYIGSWLSAWCKRAAGGLDEVIPRLRPDAKPTEPGAPDPIAHLRDYNSYLSPKLGALSADQWTLAATILRNILLNWMVLVPLLMAALMVPRLYLSLLVLPEQLFGEIVFSGGGSPNYGAPELDAVSGSVFVRYALPLLWVALFATALFNTLRYLPGIGNVDHTRADYVRGVLAPLVAAVLAYLAYDSLYYLGSTFTEQSSLSSQMLATLVPSVLAWVAYLLARKHPSRVRASFGPLSLAIFLMAAGMGLAIWSTSNFLLWSPNPDTAMSWPEYVTLAPPAILLGYILGTIVFVGLSSRFLRDEDREWMSRSVAGMLLFCAVWLLACGIVLIAPKWVADWKAWAPQVIAAAGAVSAWASAFGSALVANKAPRGAEKPSKAWTAAALAIKAAPAVFIVALAIALAVATNALLYGAHLLPGIDAMPQMGLLAVGGAQVPWQDHYAVLSRSSPALVITLFLSLLATSWILARYVNINTFSLHGMYRDRLVRAYLGASNPKRKANKFTGFARDDDFAMSALDPGQRPLHILNLTLNLVAANRLAWQQRKAQSFTVSALHCGNFELGYRPASHYGGQGGISLGTAAAISGAAASPSMGYHSAPATGFIMTLLNARLGSWLGNPGAAGARTWQHASPRSAVRSLVKEAFGMTSNQNEYVYLSDGGHFENLGLYEMVLRRCRRIVVLDSGCDPEFAFDDLGNALRKIRIDLGIPIAFEDGSMQRVSARHSRCALATIGYTAVDQGGRDGWLLYVKPMLLGSEPPDVANYGRSHPDFPHQSTNNQWFDESQTESYRMLGLTTLDEICNGWHGGSLEDLQRHVARGYPKPKSSTPTET